MLPMRVHIATKLRAPRELAQSNRLHSRFGILVRVGRGDVLRGHGELGKVEILVEDGEDLLHEVLLLACKRHKLPDMDVTSRLLQP